MVSAAGKIIGSSGNVKRALHPAQLGRLFQGSDTKTGMREVQKMASEGLRREGERWNVPGPERQVLSRMRI